MKYWVLTLVILILVLTYINKNYYTLKTCYIDYNWQVCEYILMKK